MTATKTAVVKSTKRSITSRKYVNMLDVLIVEGPEGNIIPASALFTIKKVK